MSTKCSRLFASLQERIVRAAERIADIRRFNRFYTKQIGVLREGLLDSPFSLVETRVLYELAHRHAPTAKELCEVLGLDAGYLSRILRSFETGDLLSRSASESDGRSSHLSLTSKGSKAFGPLEGRSDSEVRGMLAHLTASEQDQLVGAMNSIERSLGVPNLDERPARRTYKLRSHRPGDIGWVVHRHGELYAKEYGYDERFEALVAEIAAHFIQHLDPKRERCWIAEMNGEAVGSVFLVKLSREIAKLRLLLVEPKARGMGIGKRLVDECIRFARARHYKKIRLWTQSELAAARAIYRAAGFQMTERKCHRDFGKPNIAETWELVL